MAPSQVALALMAVVLVTLQTALATHQPGVNITYGGELPQPVDFTMRKIGFVDGFSLTMVPLQVQGPGVDANDTIPYNKWTTRVWREQGIFGGIIRVRQGDTFAVKVCNNLDRRGKLGVLSGRLDGHRDPQYAGFHTHGLHVQPGTVGLIDWRYGGLTTEDNALYSAPGDNVLELIPPGGPGGGSCAVYTYAIPQHHSPGLNWGHPHYHGSSALQTPLASFPISVFADPVSDPLNTTDCLQWGALINDPTREIIMMIQGLFFTLAPVVVDDPTISPPPPTPPSPPLPPPNTPLNADDVYDEGEADTQGFDDDTLPSLSASIMPNDPYCCNYSSTFYPFATNYKDHYIVNGVYQPHVTIVAGRIYRLRMLNTAIMHWLDLTVSNAQAGQPNCTLAMYSHDGSYLLELPRMINHMVLVPAARVEVLLQCNTPGTYVMASGYGPLSYNDDNCGTPHCRLSTQDVIARFIVKEYNASSNSTTAKPDNMQLTEMSTCKPNMPAYLSDLRNATVQSGPSVMDFTDEDGGCSINGLLFYQSEPYSTQPGKVHEWTLRHVHVHDFHLHIQPLQIIDLQNNSQIMDKSNFFLPGDYVDSFMLPGQLQATMRFWADPIIIGTTVVHCHLVVHGDEGCMARVNFGNLTTTSYSNDAQGLSRGSAATWVAGLLCTLLLAVVAR